MLADLGGLINNLGGHLSNLYRKATGDGREAVIAAIFWLKTRAGWKEITSHEIAGRDGEPIEVVDTSPRELARAIISVLATATLSDTCGRAGDLLLDHRR